jgi:hypothetical protein
VVSQRSVFLSVGGVRRALLGAREVIKIQISVQVTGCSGSSAQADATVSL